MACQGTLKCPKCDLLMRPPTSKGSKFNPRNHLYEHYMEFKREWEKDGRTKDGALPLGSFCYQCWSKEADRREREGGNIPNKVPTISYTSAVLESFDSEGKKTKNGLPIKVLEPCNDHPLPPRINQTVREREKMVSTIQYRGSMMEAEMDPASKCNRSLRNQRHSNTRKMIRKQSLNDQVLALAQLPRTEVVHTWWHKDSNDKSV